MKSKNYDKPNRKRSKEAVTAKVTTTHAEIRVKSPDIVHIPADALASQLFIYKGKCNNK